MQHWQNDVSPIWMCVIHQVFLRCVQRHDDSWTASSRHGKISPSASCCYQSASCSTTRPLLICNRIICTLDCYSLCRSYARTDLRIATKRCTSFYGHEKYWHLCPRDVSFTTSFDSSHRLRLLLNQKFLHPSEVHIHSFRNQIWSFAARLCKESWHNFSFIPKYSEYMMLAF